MRGSHEITPWQVSYEEEPFPRAISLRHISKAQRRSFILPPSEAPISTHRSVKLDSITKPAAEEFKDPIVSLRRKKLIVVQQAQRRVSSDDVLVMPPNKNHPSQYDLVPRVYREVQAKLRNLMKQVDLSQESLQQSNDSQSERQKCLLPIKMVPDSKSQKSTDKKFKSKSLNSLHNHIKYYITKSKQKENIKLQPIKFDSLQQILKRLPRRDNKMEEHKHTQLTPIVPFQTIKLLDPFPKPLLESRQQTKLKGEHFLDKLFGKMG